MFGISYVKRNKSLAGLERDKFDNKTVSFEQHIKSEHNMWHYLYFLVLVRVKDPTEYTGPESYVAQMIAVSKQNKHALHKQEIVTHTFFIPPKNVFPQSCLIIKAVDLLRLQV